MGNSRLIKPKKYVFFSFIATLLCMIGIFLLSAQPANVSDGNSRWILGRFIGSITGLIGNDMSVQQRFQLVKNIDSIARELMHGVVYFVLAIFAELTVIGAINKKHDSVIITFIFCIFYGLTDEIHQLFVPGRSFQIIDLIMDASGALIAIVLVVVTSNVVNRKKYKYR